MVEIRTVEIGIEACNGQDYPIGVVRLVRDIVFRDDGQYVQRNAGRMNTFKFDQEFHWWGELQTYFHKYINLFSIRAYTYNSYFLNTTELYNIGIFKAATEVFAVLLDDGSALNRFLSSVIEVPLGRLLLTPYFLASRMPWLIRE